jgi:hypothetical protein
LKIIVFILRNNEIFIFEIKFDFAHINISLLFTLCLDYKNNPNVFIESERNKKKVIYLGTKKIKGLVIFIKSKKTENK